MTLCFVGGKRTRLVKNNFQLFTTYPKICSKRSVVQDIETNPSSFEDSHIIDGKIIYNSKVKHFHNHDSIKKRNILSKVHSQYKSEGPPVLALKYLFNDCDNGKVSSNSTTIQNDVINLPYDRHHQVTLCDVTKDSFTNKPEEVTHLKQAEDLSFSSLTDKSCRRPNKNWMKDYNRYAEVSLKQLDEEEDSDEDYKKVLSKKTNWKYGSADPSVPSSSVPCGGCGAYLHCQDSAIPGYLPKEIFCGLKENQLQALVCQRCHFLQEYNTALSVNVDPQIYPQLLSQIKDKKAMVILVVDMTDFPCSIYPDILNIVGPKRPLIVVGNKIDLLQDWSKGWLERAKQALIKQLPPKSNVLHVALVSAKTGYGIEDLITSLYNLWEYRGDVYLVGCTNVGKSTLFNILLQSDYCKIMATDLVQRATTAPWPGTTLNLLKFPIMRPEGRRLQLRRQRLQNNNEQTLRLIQEGKSEPTPQMISCISRTFSQGNIKRYSDDHYNDQFAIPKMGTLRQIRDPGSGLDPADPTLAQSKWLYDTPGVVTPDQIINLLTTEELMLTLPKDPIVPRTFQLWPEQSLLLAGLGRIDYTSGPANIKLTVLSASTLPVTLCWTSDVEEVYSYYLGSEALTVPCGSSRRLERWSGLKAAPPFVLKGIGWKESTADIVLSSAGWVAVTASDNMLFHLQAWTPEARGIHVRIPPVLTRAVAVKGARMYKSQAYAIYNDFLKKKLK